MQMQIVKEVTLLVKELKVNQPVGKDIIIIAVLVWYGKNYIFMIVQIPIPMDYYNSKLIVIYNDPYHTVCGSLHSVNLFHFDIEPS